VSEQSLDLVRRAFAAFNRRDVDAVTEVCHPEIEWRPMRESRAGIVYSGHEGVRRALADIDTEFEEVRNDPREMYAVGDAVVVVGRLLAKERASGVRVDRPAAWLCEVRDGLVVRMTAFPDGDSAMAAAGGGPGAATA
jgi:ketosteroid isomerase-like protein